MHAVFIFVIKENTDPRITKLVSNQDKCLRKKTLFIKTQPVVVVVQCVYWVQEEPVALFPSSKTSLLCFVLLPLSSLASVAQQRAASCCSAESIEISLKAHWALRSHSSATSISDNRRMNRTCSDGYLFVLLSCLHVVVLHCEYFERGGRRLSTQKGNRTSVVSCRYLWIHCSRK